MNDNSKDERIEAAIERLSSRFKEFLREECETLGILSQPASKVGVEEVKVKSTTSLTYEYRQFADNVELYGGREMILPVIRAFVEKVADSGGVWCEYMHPIKLDDMTSEEYFRRVYHTSVSRAAMRINKAKQCPKDDLVIWFVLEPLSSSNVSNEELVCGLQEGLLKLGHRAIAKHFSSGDKQTKQLIKIITFDVIQSIDDSISLPMLNKETDSGNEHR